jgi:N-methylhydantoinase A
MSDGGALVGVDSGGTFTDLVRLDAETGELTVVKVPSTPARPIDAVRSAVAQSVDGRGYARLVHGTTVATNAILERRGARVCLLTTAGFEDVPVIQRLNRRYAFDLGWQKPAPLVPRWRTVGVRERIGANGVVLEALDDEECARAVNAVAALAERGEVDAVAVCLLFSFANADHELALERGLARALPDLPVSLSSRVSPLWREYERVSTTLADAYVRPLMASYLEDLVDGVAPDGRNGPVLMLKSNGGTGSPASVAPVPVTTILSGLAGGALGGAHFAAAVGEPHCVTLDIGGTSTDIGLVHDGSVRQRSEFEIEWGLPVVTPTVDVHAVGAGGGSIAHVDAGGLIQVGPRSAGAVPGPAAYGHGGTDATVTDANLVLGRLNPDYFLGGRMRLDVNAAAEAVGQVADASGLGATEAALAVVQIAVENVANAVRLLTIERGIDPGGYALIAYGGAGPLHACGVATALGIEHVIVPPHPGLCSAFGAAIAPLRVDRVWSLGVRSDRIPESEVRRRFEAREAEARAELERDGAAGTLLVSRTIACRYYLQNYEEEVTVADLEPGFLERAAAEFHRLYRSVYGYAFEEEPVELVHCKVAAVERVPDRAVDRPDLAPATDAGMRSVVGDDGVGRPIRIVRRGRLGNGLAGPVVIEEADSTTFVPEGWTATDAAEGCLALGRD